MIKEMWEAVHMTVRLALLLTLLVVVPAGAETLPALPGPALPPKPAPALPPALPPKPAPALPAASPNLAQSNPAQPNLAQPNLAQPNLAQPNLAQPRSVPPLPSAAQPLPGADRGAANPDPRKPPVVALRLARVSKDPRPSLTPDTFIATTRAAERYLRIAENGGWPVLPEGTALKLGDRGALVLLLRQRLAISADLPPDAGQGDVFDPALAAAVKGVQLRHGLPETGQLGPRTVQALNVPAGQRYRQLAASAQRLLGSSFAFGERYVVVNIPSATVEAVAGGVVARRYVAVVGKKDRASPAVETRITSVNINPTWTVPVSLIRKDIIPHMRKDPTYLTRSKIRILDGQGRDVDPTQVDWATQQAVNYTLRQDPGAGNSLGQIRIDMPNRHAVYMHDTPTKRLFALDTRFHSSGCVRVAEVRAFAAWLLEGTPAPTGAWRLPELDAAVATTARVDIRLARPVPVAWVYLTGYATSDGTVHFRDDVYDLDGKTGPLPTIAPDAMVTSSIPERAH